MKDFYDLWFLSRTFEFDGPTLVAAIRATFTRRKTPPPEDTPMGLRDEFAAMKSVQWNAFLRKNRLGATDMGEVLRVIRDFARQPVRSASTGETFLCSWRLGSGWSAQN